jgi:hypothetical protein
VLEKRLFELVDALEQVVFDEIIESELMNHDDWKMIHENLYNRGELNDEEVQVTLPSQLSGICQRKLGTFMR